jgi:hypothetical protein
MSTDRDPSVRGRTCLAGGDNLGHPTTTAALVTASRTSQLAGEVKVFDPQSADARIVIQLSHVPRAPAGHHYEVWVLRPGRNVAMGAIGAFTPADGKARLELTLPGPGDYIALDISIQEDGGSPEPSGQSLAGATLQ